MHRSMSRGWTWFASAVFVVVFVSASGAHNSWVVSDRTRLAAGGEVRLAFVTGHDAFPESEHATSPSRVASWEIRRGGITRRVSGFEIEGMDLAATVELRSAGVHVVAAALHPRFIELGAEKFNGYLKEEHAEAALAERRRLGADTTPGREFYTKFAKTFVRVGEVEPGDRGFAAPAGHRLEIIPLSNPTAWVVGERVRVRVLFEGEPKAGVHVSSGHESSTGHDYVEAAPTVARGEASFVLDRPGAWFLRTHVIRSLTSEEADWESFWASITVDVPGPD